MSSKSETILGLDPGLGTTGYAVLSQAAGKIVVSEAGMIRGTGIKDLAKRLFALHESLMEIIQQWKPATLAVEQIYAHYDHPRTAVLMAHARGCFLLAGAQAGIPVVSYPSTSVKKTITGHGRASKEQVQHAIMRELGLEKLPEPNDVADALAVALCHVYWIGKKVRGDDGRDGSTGSPDVQSRGVNRSAFQDDAE